jgi:hypothetical protein
VKQRYSITIQGNQHRWSFDVDIDPKYVEAWRDDGIDISEVFHVIPEWAVGAGLLRVWCFIQDIFHFRNPFG